MKAGRTVLLTVVLVLMGTLADAADCNSGGRYEDMGDGTVTDCRTGLIWLKNANCMDTSGGVEKPFEGYLIYYKAKKWSKGLHDGLCGLTDGSDEGDWRVPTKTEWMAMVASARKQGFISPSLTNGAGTGKWVQADVFDNVVVNSGYWSSTTYAAVPTLGWYVSMFDGGMDMATKSGFTAYVWPVRGEQSASFDSVTLE